MSRSISLFASLAAVCAVSVLGCSKKEYQTFEELDNANIREYIQQNNLKVNQYKETDLFYEVLEEGTGNPIDYKKIYPIVYTVKSLDGIYNSADTLSASNRYAEYFGYFPFGSSAAGTPTVEREGDFKEVIREALKNTNGKIRIIVPSRLMYGRDGNQSLGVPPNASLDYVVTVHDNFEDYEDGVIQQAIAKAGLNIEDFTKRDDNSYYQILEQGDGERVSIDSTVTVNYTLKNPDGSVKESGTDTKLNLAGGTITGFAEIVSLINKGGKVRFFLPSTLGYGIAGGASIPPFMSLDYEVEVKDE